MNNKKSLIIIVAVLAVVLVGGALAYNALSDLVEPENLQPQPGSEEGEAGEDQESRLAPDFTVTDGDGNQVKLSDLRGTPVVVNFWASWCPPCKNEMPEFEEAWQELGGEVHIMMVDLVDGSQETVEKGAAFIAEQGYTFPVYFDDGQSAARTYGIASIPTTLFVDAEGNLVTYGIGMMSRESLWNGIEMIREA